MNTATGDKIVAHNTAKREIDIEFLYLDLEVCDQCKGSEINLDEALREVSKVLEKTGVRVNVKKIHVESLEQAQSLNFISSPTTRIDGRDAAIEVKENYCSSCGTLSGNETYCRIWNFQGEEYSTVPKSLVVEAILKEIYGAGRDAKETKPEDFAPRSNICARSELSMKKGALTLKSRARRKSRVCGWSVTEIGRDSLRQL